MDITQEEKETWLESERGWQLAVISDAEESHLDDTVIRAKKILAVIEVILKEIKEA